MTDSVGDNRLHLIITIRRPKLVVGELADSVSGNRPRLIITTRGSIRAVTRSQIVGESASQPGTEKSSLANIYTGQAPLTSSPSTIAAALAMTVPQLHRVQHLL